MRAILSISLINLLAVGLLLTGGSAEQDKLRSQDGISIPLAIENVDGAPLRIESAIGGAGESRTVDGEIIRYFPFQKAVVRNVSDKEIAEFSIIFTSGTIKGGAGFLIPTKLAPGEEYTAKLGHDFLLNGDITTYKVSVASVRFSNGSKWEGKRPSPGK